MEKSVWNLIRTGRERPVIIVHTMRYAALTGKHPAMNFINGKIGKQKKSGRKYAESSSKLDQGAEPGH